MTRRIVIAGASGFVATRFAEPFRAEGGEVVTSGRRGGTGAGQADVAWADEAGIADAVAGSHLLLGLSGKSVNCRYDDENKAEIFRSRLETTAALGRAVQSV